MHKMTEIAHAIWEALPEPIKAAMLYAALAFVMAFRNDERSWRDLITETIAGGILVLIAGSAISLLGLSEGWTFVLAGALGGYGLTPTKEFIRTMLEKFLHK